MNGDGGAGARRLGTAAGSPAGDGQSDRQAYHRLPPHVIVDASVPSGSTGWYDGRGVLRLKPAFFSYPYPRALTAHELGHFVEVGLLGTRQGELAADLGAVEILVRTEGMTLGTIAGSGRAV